MSTDQQESDGATRVANITSRRRIVTVLFDGFELLDVFGPLELYGVLSDHFQISLIGPQPGPVMSSQGPAAHADHAYHDAPRPDIVLVPGGMGTRALAQDQAWLQWLADWSTPAELITSVCTGSALLAAAGLLDGYRATSNKRAFVWAAAQGPDVEWIPTARWVEDRNRWTSSGVAAGMDMTLAIISRLHGSELANTLADAVEYDPHTDAAWDPYAEKSGLTGSD